MCESDPLGTMYNGRLNMVHGVMESYMRPRSNVGLRPDTPIPGDSKSRAQPYVGGK